MAFASKTFIDSLTQRSGTYQMMDSEGAVLYVGKAKNLKKRVSSYFRKTGISAKTTALVKRIEDIGDYTNATDVPFRFVPCMVAGLAFYLSQKYQPQLTQQMKLYYEDELARALAEDGSASSTYITPKAYYPGA